MSSPAKASDPVHVVIAGVYWVARSKRAIARQAGRRQAESVLHAEAMQVVAMGIEPGLGAFGRRTDAPDHAPELHRVVHLDEMPDFMGREIVQHEGRCEDQTP